MKILVVGGGGREHALAWRLADHHDVIAAPGNPGMEAIARCVPGVGVADLDGIVELGRAEGATVRALAGPALYRVGDGGGETGGIQGRVDFSTPSWSHLAAVASARAGWLPRVRGTTLTPTALGVGIRLR